VADPGVSTPVIVVLPDEVDITNAESMREQLRTEFRPGVAVVIADMTSTAFCDVACFRNLLIAHSEAGANGTQLRLVIGPGPVFRVLMMLGFDHRLDVYPSLRLAHAGKPAD
jgi:anti-anti-sigma factor